MEKNPKGIYSVLYELILYHYIINLVHKYVYIYIYIFHFYAIVG